MAAHDPTAATTPPGSGSAVSAPQAPGYGPDRAVQAAALAAIPGRYADPPPDTLSKLPKGGDRDKARWTSCQVCGGWHAVNSVHLDYQGHADVTLALIEIDPLWEWEPALVDADTGGPVWNIREGTAVMWARLTVLGKPMLGVGTAPASKEELEKELIGDFLRNAAMRFGVATRLWSKAGHGDPGRDDADADRPGSSSSARRTSKAPKTATPTDPPAAAGQGDQQPVTRSQLALIGHLFDDLGIVPTVDRDAVVASIVPGRAVATLTMRSAGVVITKLRAAKTGEGDGVIVIAGEPHWGKP